MKTDMTLKRKKKPNSERKQLYMLEILVDTLELHPRKIANSRECDMMVRVNFIDLNPVDMIVERGSEVKDGTRSRPNGKTCVFVQIPSSFIRSIKSTPLCVKVYRIPRGKDNCNYRDDAGSRFLGAAAIFASDTICDHVIAAKNQPDGSSWPCTVSETYTLSDERGNACGSVLLYLRLSCFGSSIIGSLKLREKSYVFQGFPLDWRIRCAGGGRDTDESSKAKSYDDDALFDKIFGCMKLYDPTVESGAIHAAPALLTRPGSPPRVSMGQPGFHQLTTAEKLNDGKYRSIIYNTYPNEPTCSCCPLGRSTHPMMCRSGCDRACCMSLRNPAILRHDGQTSTVDGNPRNDDNGAIRRSASRMRGGGEEDASFNCEALWTDDFWRTLMNHRTAGGSDYDKPLSYPSAVDETTTVLYQKNKNVDSTKWSHRPNNPRNKPNPGGGGPSDSCSCPAAGKEELSWSAEHPKCFKCSRKTCVGADCLIRAFKDVQAFVDSLGKVPGMMGLGLMDPSESPYFGRDIDKDYTIRETQSEKQRLLHSVPTSHHTVPSVTQYLHTPPITSITSVPHVTTSPLPTLMMPGRANGVVREAIPILPEHPPVRLKKKEEKAPDLSAAIAPHHIHLGPCGEPRCRSRRRVTEPEDVEEPKDAAAVPSKPSAAKVLHPKLEKPKKDLRLMKRLDEPHVTKTHIKVSKRVMRYVYTIGDIYPGVHFGHKNCIEPRIRVPANMGWLWTTTKTAGKLKPRIGWKPGAINRFLNELLQEAKASAVEDIRTRSLTRAGIRRSKVYKALSYVSHAAKKEVADEVVEPPPTLHIHRKDGTYYVTMYPIKRETPDAMPQIEEPTKPLQFKIVKNKDDDSATTSSTASDMEIEFSPPAALTKYRKKPDVIHVDTQVKQAEILDAFKVPKRRGRSRRERRK